MATADLGVSPAELRWLAMALDPCVMVRALGLDPDPWQRDVLRSDDDRTLLLCCRQAGKSTTTAIKALHRALFRPMSLVLLFSPSLRQSGELFRKAMGFYADLGRPVPAVSEQATSLHLANGSRIVSLPGSHETVRGYSGAALVVIDEAAMTEDPLFVAVNPMLAVSRGQLLCLSTPFGKRGWFHDAWTSPGGPWNRVKVTAPDCPRIDPAFLAEQRKTIGERWFRQEYLCSFEDTVDQAFSTESVLAAFSSEEAPLFGARA